MGCQQLTGSKTSGSLATASRQYEQGQYGSAIKALSDFLRREPKGSARCEAHYLRGLCYRNQGRHQTVMAIRDFEAAVAGGCRGRVVGLAHTALGHTYFEGGEKPIQKALHHYQQALAALDQSPPQDAVLYRLGVCFQRRGDWAKADEYLRRCSQDFGKSEFAEKSQRRMGARNFRLQVGAYANLTHARKKIGQLNRSGWRSDMSRYNQGGKMLYMVRTGQYQSYAAARQNLQRLVRLERQAYIVAAQGQRFR